MKKMMKNARLTGFMLLLIGLSLLAACGGPEEEEQIQAPTQTPTSTSTPFPTRTPTSTPTVTPTITPTNTPQPTATPIPDVLIEATGPAVIPFGLPRSVEWRISVIDGAELVVATLDDLGGTMLAGDEDDELLLATSLVPANATNVNVNFDSTWVITGIIDPNVGRGGVSILVETANFQEVITLPWEAGNVSDVEGQSITIVLDGVDETAPIAELENQPTLSRPGFLLYENLRDIRFEYPQAWFVNDFPDGTIQLSPDPLAATDGATPAESPYTLLLAGSPAEVGIPDDVIPEVDPISDWLFGNSTIISGADNSLFLSDELEILSQEVTTLDTGTTVKLIRMQPVNDTSYEATYIIGVQEETRVFIASAFYPVDDPEFLAQVLEVANSIQIR